MAQCYECGHMLPAHSQRRVCTPCLDRLEQEQDQ